MPALDRAITGRNALIALCIILLGCGPNDTAPSTGTTPTPTASEHTDSTTAAPQPNDSANTRSAAHFTDVTATVGLDYRHEASEGAYFIIEEMGPGAAFFDFDGDDDLDLYVVQGGRVPFTERGERLANRLYENVGGHFVDVTAESGAGDTGYGIGVAAADVDGDGDTDLYVTNVGPDALLVNDGNGHFTDGTAAAGLGDPAFGTSATFADLDGDGWLDLFVAVYVPWTPDVEHACFDPNGERDYCNPTAYPAGQDRLYHNRGDGTFDDVTDASGIGGRPAYGLGVVCCDFDGDGKTDIYVANDHQANHLWHNLGRGRFEDRALEAGCAYNGDGKPEASMGIVCEDLDFDGDFDLLVAHFAKETNTFYRNEGKVGAEPVVFTDVTMSSGLGRFGIADTSFGIGLIDVDNDGQHEIFIANGAVMRKADSPNPNNPYAEHNRLLGIRDGKFVDLTASSGVADGLAQMSRGAAFADYDGDGDVDVLIANNRGPLQLLRNDGDHGNSLRVRLRTEGGNRQAIGAVISVDTPRGAWRRLHTPFSSYLVSNDPRSHFGLGAMKKTCVTVEWPSGRVEEWRDVAANRMVTLVEGSGTTIDRAPTVADANTATPGNVDPPRQHPALPILATPYPWGDAQAKEVARLSAAEDYDAAIAVARTWLMRAAKDVGMDHREIMRAASALSLMYRKAGRSPVAIRVLEQLIGEFENHERAEHPTMLRLRTELASHLIVVGRDGQAEIQYLRALELGNAILGAGSPQCAQIRGALSQFYQRTGSPAEAERVALTGYESARRAGAMSEAAIDLLATAARLAQRAERHPVAVQRYDEAATRYRELLGEHTKTAAMRFEAGREYAGLRDFNHAIERFTQAATLREHLLGADAVETLTARGELGRAQCSRGDFAAAEATLSTTAAAFERLRGENDLLAVSTRRSLADVYAKTHRLEKAATLLEAVARVYEGALPPGDPSLAACRQSLANVRRALAAERNH